MKEYGELGPDDEMAIRNLYARYSHAIHRGEAEAWAECFTEDGRFSNRGTGVAGRADLVAYASGWIGVGGANYWIDNVLLRATKDGVLGTCYLTIIRAGRGDQVPSVSLTGIYTDTLQRVGGAWKFASRHIERDE